MTSPGVDATARTLRVAITQWHATLDVDRNLDIAERLIAAAGAEGARLIVLPENGLFLGTNVEMCDRALDLDGAELARLGRAASRARSGRRCRRVSNAAPPTVSATRPPCSRRIAASSRRTTRSTSSMPGSAGRRSRPRRSNAPGIAG